MSHRRMIRLSTQPPKYAAQAPKNIPKNSATSVGINPIVSETREPWMILANTSRPSGSMPKMCSSLGGSIRSDSV